MSVQATVLLVLKIGAAWFLVSLLVGLLVGRFLGGPRRKRRKP